MISATQRMAYTRRSPGLTFKLATGRIRPIGRLGTQERVAVGADRLTSWFPDSYSRLDFFFFEKSLVNFETQAILANFCGQTTEEKL